jgi:Family of unknown function (DUF6352)
VRRQAIHKSNDADPNPPPRQRRPQPLTHNLCMQDAPHTLWPGSGHQHLQSDAQGRLQATPAYWRHWLARPELALVTESCRAERALHAQLLNEPLRQVAPAQIHALADADVAHNWRHFLALRDAVQSAGSVQAWYLALLRAGPVTVPPLFVDLTIQAIVQSLLSHDEDALTVRAAELFFRPQRITFAQGRVLAADRATLEEQAQTQGLGDLGRLLAQAKISTTPLDLPVLGPDHAARYWAEASRDDFRSSLVLDLTQQLSTDVGHGLQFKMTNARSGLKPLALLLQRWVQHLLGVEVLIEPVHRIDDPQWRWHVGLDVEASALLNDLYQGHTVDDERLSRLISLFRLTFANANEMRRDVAGKPVYLGLMASAQGQLRLKPQNLVLNLPLATAS